MTRRELSAFLQYLTKYRFKIGCILFVLAVLLQLNGSSAGMWNTHIGGQDPQSLIIAGENRPIRSDEWCVFTPMALSQYHNDFRYESSILRGTDTDVYMVYGQPVRDWTIIFRPFQLGYLFLSPGRGLSFYWCGKLIVLFLVSLEFGFLITRKKGIQDSENSRMLLPFTYATMVTFAPVVQWWFSTNAFPDMLVYGQGLLLCLAAYMETDSYRKRMLYALCMIWMAGAYILVLYPAWQIPFFYVFLFLGLWIISSHWKRFDFSWKKDLPILIVSTVMLCFCMVYIINRSWDAIMAVMHSVYPGARMETGDGGFPSLFRYVGNLMMPFTDQGIPGNVCENAAFYDLFPLGILLSFPVLYRERDRMTFLLVLVTIFLGIYMIAGFPEGIARLTLMSNVPTNRCAVALSYANLLLMIRGCCLIHRKQDGENQGDNQEKYMIITALGLASAVVWGAWYYEYRVYFTIPVLFLCGMLLISIYIFFIRNFKVFCIILCISALIMGGTVNPVRAGLDDLMDHPLGNAIRELSTSDTGKWMAVTDNWVVGNFLIMYGAPAVNSTNTYVNRELWDKLDPERKYEEVYNRYAHMDISLIPDSDTEVSLISPDHIHVNIDPEELVDMGVSYVVSDQDLLVYNNKNIDFQPVFSAEGIRYRIYKVEETQ